MPASLQKEVLMHVTSKMNSEDIVLSETRQTGVGQRQTLKDTTFMVYQVVKVKRRLVALQDQ